MYEVERQSPGAVTVLSSI